MKEGSKLCRMRVHHVFILYMLGCNTKVTFAALTSQPIKMNGMENVSKNGEDTNAVHSELVKGYSDLRNVSAGDVQMSSNSTTLSGHLIVNETLHFALCNTSCPDSISDGNHITERPRANITSRINVSGENIGPWIASSHHDWSSLENMTDVNASSSTLNKEGISNQLSHNSTYHALYYTFFGEDSEPTEFNFRKTIASHKLLAMFLGMAVVLAALLVLVYCIYSRQHKEDMFSHHRLYGEGFEDPVLHLDTPVDHFDFFSFKDTEITPTPTPLHKPQNYVINEPKQDNTFDVPKETHSNENSHQNFQMSSLNIM
ncbi:Golgi-associated olfactory signaling regulator [Pelobates fuscus]|uniref:Golgi-associated olfactory signaling regulator n=1 Tax=Pelobates fuscus TaxID=191477 RepID=UPI002FE4CB5A